MEQSSFSLPPQSTALQASVGAKSVLATKFRDQLRSLHTESTSHDAALLQLMRQRDALAETVAAAEARAEQIHAAMQTTQTGAQQVHVLSGSYLYLYRVCDIIWDDNVTSACF